MIPSVYYHTVYLIFVSLLSIFTFFPYNTYSTKRLLNTQTHTRDLSLFVLVLLTFYIGFRSPTSQIFGDTYAYTRWYNNVIGDIFIWDWNVQNFLFINVMLWMSSVRIPVEFFYVFVAFLYFGGIWLCCRKIFPEDTLTTFVIYLAAFSTYAAGVNGLKAGAAASMFLVSISMHENNQKIWSFVFLFFSLGMHHAMLMPITAFFICCFIKNPKFYAAFWIICFIMAALHVTFFQNLFVGFGEDIDEKVVGYLAGEGNAFMKQKTGFRIDFILYSFLPILVGWVAVFKKNIKSEAYFFLLNLYTFINGIWMLCMYALFTNRIAYLSWLMYPIVLIYPFLKEKWGPGQYKTFKWVAYGHLAFTLFMYFIYD